MGASNFETTSFERKFQNVFLESSSKENKNLLVKDKNI